MRWAKRFEFFEHQRAQCGHFGRLGWAFWIGTRDLVCFGQQEICFDGVGERAFVEVDLFCQLGAQMAGGQKLVGARRYGFEAINDAITYVRDMNSCCWHAMPLSPVMQFDDISR